MKINADIDIDVADRDKVLDGLEYTIARIDRETGYDKHNTGVYFQKIPTNPLDNVATIDHKEAEELGYFKVDFLNVKIYEGVKNEEHLNELVSTEPKWELLQDDEFVSGLFHVNKYPNLLKRLRPSNIEELAMVLAMIRPSKRYLMDKDWYTIKKEIWQKPKNGGYWFKKGHAISYAMAVVVQMNLQTIN